MKFAHLSALSLAVVLGLVTGCGEEKAATPPQGQVQALDLYPKTLAPELRAIAWDIGDADQVGVIPALELAHALEVGGTERTQELNKAVEEIQKASAEYDALRTQLLAKLNASEVAPETIAPLTQELADLRTKANAIGKQVADLSATQSIDAATIRAAADLTPAPIELSRRVLLASSYDVDEESAAHRAETATVKLEIVDKAVAEIDARLLSVRKEIATSTDLNNDRLAVLSAELQKIAADYAKLPDVVADAVLKVGAAEAEAEAAAAAAAAAGPTAPATPAAGGTPLEVPIAPEEAPSAPAAPATPEDVPAP